jgi:hypothetical protein
MCRANSFIDSRAIISSAFRDLPVIGIPNYPHNPNKSACSSAESDVG